MCDTYLNGVWVAILNGHWLKIDLPVVLRRKRYPCYFLRNLCVGKTFKAFKMSYEFRIVSSEPHHTLLIFIDISKVKAKHIFLDDSLKV